MAYVIFRGLNGRRQEADFGDEPIDVKIHANEDVVEICIELTGDRWRRQEAIRPLVRAQA